MVLWLAYFLHESNPQEGSSTNCSLFILSLHALALHLAVKILLQIFLYEDLSTLALHTSVSLYFPPECQQDHRTLLRNNANGKSIPCVTNLKSSTNTRRSDQIETIKTIMQTNALVSHGRFYQWLKLPFFKEIFDQVRKDLDCELFYSELKRHNVSHYVYYLAAR